MRKRPPRYQVYLLRCWEERSQQRDGPAGWRFSLEDPERSRRWGFVSLVELVAFLEKDTGDEGLSNNESEDKPM
jgi:hypothetical protein